MLSAPLMRKPPVKELLDLLNVLISLSMIVVYLTLLLMGANLPGLIVGQLQESIGLFCQKPRLRGLGTFGSSEG